VFHSAGRSWSRIGLVAGGACRLMRKLRVTKDRSRPPPVLPQILLSTQASKRGVVLALCVAAHTFLSIDRGLMAVLQEAIKRDLLLSDSQPGLLSGLGFGLFFGIASLPIGWLVDRFKSSAP
jgi:hypothetical protein